MRSTPSRADGGPHVASRATTDHAKATSHRTTPLVVRATRQQELVAAMDPSLAGCRASAWLRRWDKGVRAVRLCLLEAFLLVHADSNIATVEKDLGDSAPLFFARLTAWLRLSYKSFMTKSSTSSTPSASPPSAEPGYDAPHQSTSATADGPRATTAHTTASASPSAAPVTPILLLVKAITVFVRGVSYMTQLVESGTTAALTDCLACGSAPVPLAVVLNYPPRPTSDGGFEAVAESVLTSARTAHPYALLTTDERRCIIVLLLFMANAGRVYREMICDEEDSLLQLLHAMQREHDANVAELLMELFSTLSQGNPRVAPLLQTALVRVVLCHQYMDLGNVSDSQLQRTRAFLAELDTSRLEVTQTVDVAMQAARALHVMQLAKEAHYLASNPGQEVVDRMPLVGLCSRQFAPLFAPDDAPTSTDPLLVDVKANEYLSAIFYLILHDTSTRLRVEGSELLALCAKNTELTRPTLDQCFDAMDDDLLVVADEDNVAAMRRRQRRQLSCGRAAVQIILSRPMTASRYELILNVISLRSAHMTLLKYLRMTENGDAASVVDGCRAIQLLARASDDRQREAMLLHVTALHPMPTTTTTTPLAPMGAAIREAVGDALHQVLLHQEISEEEAFTLLRAARSTATGFGG